MSVLMVRQSIVNSKKQSYGFELIHHQGHQQNTLFSHDKDTAEVILNRFSGIQKENNHTIEQKPIFVSMDGNFLLSKEIPEYLYSSMVVNLNSDANALSSRLIAFKNSLSSRKDSSLIIRYCLDDFALNLYSDVLLLSADFIKINLQNCDRSQIPLLLKKLSDFTGKIIFKNVDTVDDFNFCKQLKGDLFQGQFLGCPILV